MARRFDRIRYWFDSAWRALAGTVTHVDALVRDEPSAGEEVDRLPESFVRGIRKGEWVKDGYVAGKAFEPDRNAKREDGHWDASINWEDAEDALRLLLSTPHGRYGAAQVRTQDFEAIARLPQLEKLVFCERRRVEGNPYHGNIVFRSGTRRQVERAAADMIAISSTFLPPAANE